MEKNTQNWRRLVLFIVVAVMIAALIWMISIIGSFLKLHVAVGEHTQVAVTQAVPGKAESATMEKTEGFGTIENAPKPETLAADYYKVVKVVDGDTIDVIRDGVSERVRLIGINTPETVDPRRPVQCFGPEASKKAKELLTGKDVILKDDRSQDDKDKYGRILRYVFLEDGTNYNDYMLREGFAYEYTYKKAYLYQNEFKGAEAEAKKLKKGLWSELTCNGRP